MENLSPSQAIEASMQRSWYTGPSEQSRLSAAQPHWQRLMQTHRRQTLPPVSETSADQNDSQPGQEPWNPPDGYQSSISTQRQADAASDDQLEHEKDLDEATYDEYWDLMYGAIY